MSSFQKTGDWDKAARLIKALHLEWEKAKDISLKRWALKAEGVSKMHISAQDLGWQALKAETISRKVKKGYSENILVQSSDYFQAITSWVIQDPDGGGTAYAGVRKSAKNAEGEEIGMIAKVHEFGSASGTIPARPLWRPTFDEVINWFDKSESTPLAIFTKNIKKYM